MTMKDIHKLRTPLRKRTFRELKKDWTKYFVISAFMILIIGFVSGMYVANHSMLVSYDEGIESHKLEDGHFELANEADDKLIDKIEEGTDDSKPVSVYKLFHKDTKERTKAGKKSTVRVYQIRKGINEAYIFKGKLPGKSDEIAIDRMHADNVGVKVGDTIRVGGKDMKVTGLVANPDYSTLYENNNEIMFDAIGFDIGLVTKEAFESLDSKLHYTYAFRYINDAGEAVRPKDKIQEKKWSDDFVKKLGNLAFESGDQVLSYLPNYGNNAIHFAPDDMGKDKAMGGVLLDVLVVVLAFIFAITVSNTIVGEASTIGTLRASGYTKWELIKHYMKMPVLVTFVSAVVGNVLGYTVFKDVVVGMYYNSYSLPVYRTVFSMEAFINTTVVPVILMFVVNILVITKKMNISPLRFLRHDFTKKKRKKAMRLPRWSFLSRFRLRVLFQNLTGYVVMFVGIFFVLLMLAFCVSMPETLEHYQKNAANMMIAPNQTILSRTIDETGKQIETSVDSEKFAAMSLLYKTDKLDEEVTFYGIEDDSKYVSIPEMDEKEVCISSAFSEKYNLKKHDTFTLKEEYRNRKYKFTVKDVIDCEGQVAVFTGIVNFRSVMDKDEGYYNALFSDEKIDDIPDKYVVSTISKKNITKMTKQLDHSMGSYMDYFQYLCIALSAVLLFLLTKLIIEKNKNAISMVKILGYTDFEIAKIYLMATTWVVVISEIIAIPLSVLAINYVWKQMMMEMSGYFTMSLSVIGRVKMFAFVFVGYLIVMLLDFYRIKKVPLSEALKNME